MIGDIEDFKVDGKWATSKTTDGVRKITTGWAYWKGIVTRTKVAGSCQQTYPTYAGTINGFENFQSFVSWATNQIGYGEFQLDKDLLNCGDKIYSPESCVFIPKDLNLILIKCDKLRGKYPVGVCLDNSAKKYKAGLRIEGNRKNLGLFPTPEEAFEAYKAAKEAEIKRQANIWKDRIDPRAYDALMKYEVRIDD